MADGTVSRTSLVGEETRSKWHEEGWEVMGFLTKACTPERQGLSKTKRYAQEKCRETRRVSAGQERREAEKGAGQVA